MLDFQSISYIFYALLALVLVIFLFKNDEFLLVVISFFYSSGLARYELVAIDHKKGWVYVAYAKKIFSLNHQLGLEALNLFMLGTALFCLSYAVFRIFSRPAKARQENQKMLLNFVRSKQQFILVLFVFFLIVNTLFQGIISNFTAAGGSISMGVSYFFYFGFALGGLILLMFLAYRSVTFSQAMGSKLVFGLLILFAAYSSYNPLSRFQFVSWVISIGIVYVRNMAPLKKSGLYIVGTVVLGVVFSLAGETRIGSKARELETLTLSQRIERGFARLNSAEDANMLDGLMMVMQVYPYHLPHSYGMEHFEILLRPIPRAIWKDKPVGGYHNKLGLNENMQGATVGISPSIYGSFYAEGGVTGIIILSLIYGYVFMRFFRWAETYNSDLRYIIKGLVISSTIPLLRGGDLPGIIAFIGMTYWPVFLFIYQYNGYIKREDAKRRAEAFEAEREALMRKRDEDLIEMV